MRAKLQAALPLVTQKAELRQKLLANEFGNRLAYLDSQQALVEMRHELIVPERRGGEVLAARTALERQVEQARAAYARDVLKELSEAEQKAAGLDQQLRQAAHRTAQTVLTAPISGTVQQLAVHTIGGVVTPAQALLTIVPDDAPVLIEAMVENKDVGFVRAGQEVEVKVETFQFTRYGLLRGHVVDISRDAATEDPRRDSSGPQSPDRANSQTRHEAARYVALVALDDPSILVDGRREKLSPGMAVTAEIRTGQRRVIEYLLSRLGDYRQSVGRER